MRFSNPLEDLIPNRTAVRLLRVLSRFPGREFTGRGLAIEAGASHPNAIRELNRMLTQGILVTRTVGRAHVWQWPLDHYLTEPLAALFAAEAGAPEALRQLILGELSVDGSVERIVLFGSVARGETHAESDIDVLVMISDETARTRVQRRLDRLRGRIGRVFGNSFGPIVYTTEEARRKKRLPLLKNVDEDGLVLLDRAA